jgi:predicted alpha/beta superfamily hydrolase
MNQGVKLLAFLVGAAPLPAQVAGDSLLHHGVQLTLPAGALPESRTLWIHLPPGYQTGTDRYDVLYVLDANALFPLAASVGDYLSMMGRIPGQIVVGITSLSPADRARNFTPVVDESRRDRFPTAGGADRFIKFLEDDVFPVIEQKYRVTSRRRIAGHSLAGLFVLHTLAVRPELFAGYIAISPSLGWAQGHTLREMETLLARPVQSRFVFASIGNEPGDYSTSLARLETILQDAPGDWRWKIARYPNEDHVTTVPPALHEALRAAFE